MIRLDRGDKFYSHATNYFDSYKSFNILNQMHSSYIYIYSQITFVLKDFNNVVPKFILAFTPINPMFSLFKLK